MTGTCGDQARVMLWQGPAIVSVDRLARCVDFHAECDRHYTSRAGTVTPCKMLSSKSGRSEVMFANGKASVCSAQLSWRRAPAAAKRSEQQASEQQAREQATVEASATVRRQKEGRRTAPLEQASAVQATEAEVSAVLHDPRYRQAGLTKGAAQQIAQMKRDSSRARQERRQGEERYQTALVEKGREQMEGWDWHGRQSWRHQQQARHHQQRRQLGE